MKMHFSTTSVLTSPSSISTDVEMIWINLECWNLQRVFSYQKKCSSRSLHLFPPLYSLLIICDQCLYTFFKTKGVLSYQIIIFDVCFVKVSQCSLYFIDALSFTNPKIRQKLFSKKKIGYYVDHPSLVHIILFDFEFC